MTSQETDLTGSFLVRALFDFSEVQHGEICLKVNDFIQVLSQTSENWWLGRNLTDANEPVGNFPVCFVENINLPGLKTEEKLCLSVVQFRTDVAGDLAFDGNELIIATRILDNNWCEGKICNGDEQLGIFPRSFIKEIHLNNVAVSSKDAEDVPTEPCSSETREVLARGMAVLDIEASCDEELSLKDGWPVEIYEVLDSSFVLGRCSNPWGKIGKFLIEFILITEGEENLKLPSVSSSSRTKFDWWKNPEVELELISKQKGKQAADVDKIVPSFEEQTAPLTLDDEDDDIDIVKHNDGVSCSDDCAQVLAESTEEADVKHYCHLDIGVQCNHNTKIAQAADANIDNSRKNDEEKETKNSCGFQSFCEVSKTSETNAAFLKENTDISITCCTDILSQRPLDHDLFQKDEFNDVDVASSALANVVIDGLMLNCIVDFDGKCDEEGKFFTNDNSLKKISVDKDFCTASTCVPSSTNTNVMFTADLSNVSHIPVIIETNCFPSSTSNEIDYNSDVPYILGKSLSHESFLIAEDASQLSDERSMSFNLEHSIDPQNNKASEISQEFIDELKTDRKPPADILERPPLPKDFGYTATADQDSSKIAELKSSVTFQLEENSAEITKHVTVPKPMLASEFPPSSLSASLVKPKPSAKPPILKPKPQFKSQTMERHDGVTLLSPEVTTNEFLSNVAVAIHGVTESVLVSKKLREAEKVEATTSKSKSVFYVQPTDSSSVLDSPWQANHPINPNSPEFAILTEDRSVTFHRVLDYPKVDLKPEGFGSVPAEMEHIQPDKINPITGKELRPAPRAPAKDVRLAPRPVPKRPEQPKNFSPNLSGSGALMLQTSGFWPSDVNSSNSSPVSSPGELSMKLESSSGPSPGKMTTHSSPLAPSRPAPPKPARAGLHGKSDSTKTSTLSDVNGHNSDKQVDNSIVEDIEKRIMETEQDLEKCIKEQSKILEQIYENEGMPLSPEVSDDLHFFQANIQGLSDELTQLRAILKEMKPESMTDASLSSSSSSSLSLAPQSLPTRIDEKIARRKREEQRKKVISELIQSELDFLQGVCGCYEVFFEKSNSIKCPKYVDLDFLFGNMHEVIELSQRFFNLLEGSTNGKDFHEQIIGSCFEEVGEDLKKVHSVYCRNHDEVISALTRLEANTEALHYFDYHLEILRKKQMVFDLGSVLIKPVQRIMKYPLLIGELIKNTEKDHPDFNHLLAADATIKDVALFINEYKRRKDLVSKYKKPTDAGFGEMISKISIHSIKKKFNRFVTPAQSQDGMFAYEENRFKHINLVVRNLIRDMTQYLDFLQVSLMDLESFVVEVGDHCRDGEHRQDLISLEEIYSCIYNQICAELKEKVEEVILPTLTSLLSLYQGPREIMRKRQHKLLDYDNASIKLKNMPEQERTQLMKDEVDFLRKNYEALNSQLLEDMPKLYHASLSVVQDCLLQFIVYQHKFVKNVKEEIQKVLELDLFCTSIESATLSSPPLKSSSSLSSLLSSPTSPPLSPSTPAKSPTPTKKNQTCLVVSHTCMSSFEIINEFTLLHSMVVDKLSELSFTPVSFNPLIEEKQKSPTVIGRVPSISMKSLSQKYLPVGGPQNENSLRVQLDDARSKVQSSFSPDKLYTVVEDFSGGELLDLKLSRGTLVGVIKEEDPMKNKDRFFVSDGVEKGFILRAYLVPHELQSSTSTEHIVTAAPLMIGGGDDKSNRVDVNNDCSGGADNDEKTVGNDYDYIHDRSPLEVTTPSVSHDGPDCDTDSACLYSTTTSQSFKYDDDDDCGGSDHDHDVGQFTS